MPGGALMVQGASATPPPYFPRLTEVKTNLFTKHMSKWLPKTAFCFSVALVFVVSMIALLFAEYVDQSMDISKRLKHKT